jgi:hypothetical protein
MKSGTRIALCFVVAVTILGEQVVAAKEPPKPTSAATKKPAIDAATEAKYQALVANLPPEEQAWERTSQANLGSFYLPIHKRERVKGIPNAWAYVKDDPKLPRILLIGDSVSRGYTMAVRKALAGNVNPHDVHFNAKGYELLGGQVAQSILANLQASQQPYTDEQLYSKADEAWRACWERFYDDRTHLFYDRVCSYDPKKRLAAMPTPDEISRQFPNRNGWGSGMEDCAISGGVMLSMICDRFEATRDETLRQPAGKAFDGMVLLGTLSPSEGFVIRGVCPADQRSHYCESSRDQYTWYAYGLWRYYRSPLSLPAEKAMMRNIIAAICARLERNVVAKNDWHIGREDGTFDGLVDKMWHVLAHEAARLPMIYAIGADLTGNNRWRDLARRFSPEAAVQSKGDSTKIAYALLQEQVSLEPLYQLEDSPELKRQWLEAMRLVSARASVFLGKCSGYSPPDAEKVNLDWRSWPTRTSLGYLVPVTPDIVVKEDRTVRQTAEAALTRLLCPGVSLTPDQLALLKQTIAQVDYSKAVMYGLYYTQAVYWRAVRLGLLKLPAGTRG